MRTPLRSLALPLALAFQCGIAAPACAQEMGPPPTLETGVDPLDWESYFDYGVSIIRRSPSKADLAFYWAMRMDPTRAEPIYARWVAFWMNDISEFEDYLDENKRVLSEPKVLASDSIRYRAYERNPVVNQALLIVLLEQVRGGWGTEAYARGFQQYAGQYYPAALKDFYIALAKDDAKMTVRYAIALVYAQTRKYDSAAAQYEAILELVKKEQARKSDRVYESNAMLEYWLGMLYEAQGRALRDDLSLAAAHVALGRLATAERDLDVAVNEYALAAQVAPGDGAIQYWYGAVLLRAERASEAVEHLRAAIQLEPYFAKPYFSLGAAYEQLNDRAGAIAAYGDFLKRAPRSSAAEIATANDHLAKLGGKSP